MRSSPQRRFTVLKIQSDHGAKVVLETGSDVVWAVAFHPDGIHVFGGTSSEIRRWRLSVGEEVGKQTGMNMNAISLSMDHRCVVCGHARGASVWDAEIRGKLVEVESGEHVYAVDVAPDCTRFATGTRGTKASIWSITTGQRLVGPLELGGDVDAIKFSPDGGRIAIIYYSSSESGIQIFNSRDGDKLIFIENSLPPFNLLTLLAWSMDSQQLFAISTGRKIKSFDSSTGSQLAEWQIHENNDDDPMSIALASNNTFIASCSGRSVSFWDTSTHSQIGIVEDTEKMRSIALSPDGGRLVAGSSESGRIIIWDLSGILPQSYLSTNVSTRFLISRIPFIHRFSFPHACEILVRLDPRT